MQIIPLKPSPVRSEQGRREGGGLGGHVPPEIPMLKKLGRGLVNALLQLLLAASASPPDPTRVLPLDTAGGLVPSPPVLSRSETNFWLRPGSEAYALAIGGAPDPEFCYQNYSFLYHNWKKLE